MSLLLPVGTIPVGIQQLITSGSQFDGAVSTTTPTLGQGMTKYPTDVKGGFFHFENNEPIVVHHILANFGVAVTYTFSVVNLDASNAIISGESLVFATGTATTFAQTVSIVLGTKQAIQLVTSGGAGAAKIARVWATSFRGYQG